MEKLQVQIVLEVLGRPPEHLKEALNSLITRLESEKGAAVLEKKIHEPILVKDAKDLFTSFAEVTLEVETLNHLIGIVFVYMPSNVELIYPEKIDLKNDEINSLMNNVLAGLHKYDAIAKKMIADREILIRKLAEVSPESFKKEAIDAMKVDKSLKDSKAKSPKKKSKKNKKSR